MKTIFCGLLLALTTGGGCMTANPLGPRPPAAATAVQKPKPGPAVTADQITATNAHQKLHALLAELDRQAE